ncbi:PREDICTED: transcription factor MYC1-like [Tarenaya hassleriana]|uniref:transcription factor MYC1-like n=1 Tax=Tarenaya hassleriana TaxID=28532 RepID=UPI00053C2182|nr:PREDICTED: transcription factor MYC1-like [Tarenaya hassleriana]
MGEGTAEAERNRILRKQLAVAVRSVQWSYAIFWCSSPTQHGALEWGEGYYNGDIKRRKKSSDEEMGDEFKAECRYGLQRSKQLRQLYLFMLEGDATTITYDDNTVLSSDDLTDEEWYYLVCMSYVFSLGQGLPGTSLATGETIWLCNAQYAESKLFTRSLLARSASIQTVVCFPFSGGVIELGVTDLIAEDHNLLQHVKACLLDTSKPNCIAEDFSVTQNSNSDDEHNQMGFRISQGNSMLEENFQELREGNRQNVLGCADLGSAAEDIHYRRTVSSVLSYAASRRKKAHHHHHPSNLDSSDSGSSFFPWKQRGTSNVKRQRQPQHPQSVLRKILYDVPSMHTANMQRMFERETFGHQNQEIQLEHGDSSDRRRENEKFRLLGSMVPTVDEIDKESILNNTIKYLCELEARVEELESCMGSVNFVEIQRKMNLDPSALIEETSDNYESTKIDVNTAETERIGGRDVRVKLKGAEVVIEIRCAYREYIVADIMEAISNLHMDAFSVRSNTLNGFLVLNLKAKFRRNAVASVGMIKRELRRVAGEF